MPKRNLMELKNFRRILRTKRNQYKKIYEMLFT